MVRGLRNSRALISGLDRPSRASLAICSSCGVSSSIVSTERLRTFSPVASNSRRARSAKASMPISTNSSWAARSCSRASTRRPYDATTRHRAGVRGRAPGAERSGPIASIASRYWSSAVAIVGDKGTGPSLDAGRRNRYRRTASCRMSSSNAARATSVAPERAAASTSSGRAQVEIQGSKLFAVAWAADIASS